MWASPVDIIYLAFNKAYDSMTYKEFFSEIRNKGETWSTY